jgi:thioredoxin 2
MDQTTHQLVHCPACRTGNRLPPERIGSAEAKCGKCGAALFPAVSGAGGEKGYKLRCAQCGARNRVPAARVDQGPKCGRCGSVLPTRELFLPQPVMVTDANFEAKVLKSPLPVLLFAWASWCPTCGTAAPIIEQFAAESKGTIRVAKVNVDKNPALAGRFNILSVPFLFVFDRGELKESMPGALQKHELALKMGRYA